MKNTCCTFLLLASLALGATTVAAAPARRSLRGGAGAAGGRGRALFEAFDRLQELGDSIRNHRSDCTGVRRYIEYERSSLAMLDREGMPEQALMGSCGDRLGHGQRCKATCRSTHRVSGNQGAQWITCNDGKLSGGDFSCIGPCPLSALKNAYSMPPWAELATTGPNQCREGQASGTTCAAQCQAGYLPSAEPLVKCYNGRGHAEDFHCCKAPRKNTCSAVNHMFDNRAWHKEGLDKHVGFDASGMFYTSVREIGDTADEAAALRAAAANRGARIVDENRSLKRNECKVSEVQGTPQSVGKKTYAIKHSVVSCATGSSDDAGDVAVTSDLLFTKCAVDSRDGVPHKCEARALNSDVTFALNDDGSDSLTLNVGVGVAGACNAGHNNRLDPNRDEVYLCLNDAYAKAATVGLSYDNDDGGHFGVALNLLGTKGGHGYFTADPTQVKFQVPVPVLPGVGLSFSVGFPGFDDPELNKAMGTTLHIASSVLMPGSWMAGPLAGTTELLRPGAGVMPSTGDAKTDRDIGIALDVALIASTGPFGAIGVAFKHIFKGPTAEEQAANAAGTICAELLVQGKLEVHAGAMLQCVCEQTEVLIHADHCQKKHGAAGLFTS